MPTTRQAIKPGTRQTRNATHKTAIMHWEKFSAGGIPLLQCINKWVGLAAGRHPTGPKGPHASEASDEPRSGEEPVPEATH